MNASETKVEHTPEPWTREGRVIFKDHTTNYLVDYVYSEYDAERIVQCVNACAGIADPQSAIEAARDALKWLSECSLNESNCASFDVANKRIRNIARQALEKLGGA